MSNHWDAARCHLERVKALELQEREIRIHNEAWKWAPEHSESELQRMLNEAKDSFNERVFHVALQIKRDYLTPPAHIRCEGCRFDYPNGHPSQKYHMGLDGCLNQVVNRPNVRRKHL